jgi:MFS family permease
MHPDPRELGRAIARLYPESDPSGGRVRSLQQIFRQPGVIVATLAMVLSQFVMVLLMVINSLHMSDHGHSLNNIALVVSAHTTGMFAFSVISGRLADRWGREPVIMLGAAILILACLLTPLSPQLLPLTMALFLLGLGWNLCYVGGSSLLADQLAPAERAHAQGLSDLLVGLASAFASLGSGLIFAALGIVAIGWMGVVLALIPLLLTKVWRGRHAPATTA